MAAAMLLIAAMAVSRRSFLTALPAAAIAPHAARGVVPLLPSQTPRATSTVAAAVGAPSAAVEFWSGLLAGAVQKTVKELALHPLDTAKARLQLAGPRRKLLAELFRAPYAGLGPAIASGAPAASTFFAVKDAVKTQCLAAGISDTTASTFISVAGANVAYWGIKNPAEVLKVRRQAGTAGDTLEAARALWRAEGLRGFYVGSVANFAYAFPVDSAKFLLYEAIKLQLRARSGQDKLSPVESAIGGALSTSAAQALATPLDVARVRIITAERRSPAGAAAVGDAGGEGGAAGVVETVRKIAAEEGVAALYSGVSPKVLRAVLAGAIQFSTYEITKDWAEGFLAKKFPRL
eukprot:scaffold18374_cov124-Isochrysis_galbana.AAC.1